MMNTLETRFLRPRDFVAGVYRNALGARIRYGVLKAQEDEKAAAIFMDGQSGSFEVNYETINDLAKRGVTTYFLERHGDGGSQRCYADPQIPPALPHEQYVDDALQFVHEVMKPQDDKPLLALGHCLGGLIALRTAQKADHLFDHCVLTSPLFGVMWPPAHGEKNLKTWAAQNITAENEQRYCGKAGPWSWDLAQKLMQRDQTTHDAVRGSIKHQWWLANSGLCMGGLTEGNVIQNTRSVLQATRPDILQAVATPVTIISSETDCLNDIEAHKAVARGLRNGRWIQIASSYHGLWRETDSIRNQVLDQVEQIAVQCANSGAPRRSKPGLIEYKGPSRAP